MSDGAVQRATGKTWNEWFALLDRGRADAMPHREIAVLLCEKHRVGDWWCQMIAVEYEKARGLRVKYQSGSSFKVSVTKVLKLSLPRVYRAWTSERLRADWLDAGPVTIRKATTNKSLRIIWNDGKTSLEVNFYAKGPEKSLVSVQHSKLMSPRECEEKKKFWKSALTSLAESLGG